MIATFVASYGYLAVFLGTLLEGETIFLAAGFAAHQGLLEWWLVVVVAFLGATLGDLSAFLLGRWKGGLLIARFPAIAQRAPRVHALLERNDVLFIIGVRFLYGFRIAGPVVIGTSSVPLLRFAVLNMIGAAVWAMLMTSAGYYIGMALEALFVDIRRVEGIILVAILVAGFLVWLWRRKRAIGLRTSK
jgi:membrane protein DedA with SNARE-associated domain